LKDWDNEIFDALAHPVRRRIIERLQERNALSYSELLKLVDISNHGKIGFHIRALEGLVERESSRKYRLTEKGLLASELMWDIRFLLSRGRRGLAYEPTTYARNLKSGDHAFLLYNTEDSKHEISFSFLEGGLARGEAAAFLVSERKLDSENREVQQYGVTTNHFRSEAFIIMSAEEWYMKKGKAQARRILANWLELLKAKQEEGYKGLRVAGEMAVFFECGKGKELLKYEAMLGKQLVNNLCGLCVYNANMLDEKQCVQLSKYHGHLISKDMAWKLP
jgi:DNA-binding transcriptional ArsR family regulator